MLLFALLARVTEQLVGDFKGQGLANIAWAYAKTGQSDAQLFTVLLRVVEQCIGYFTTQELVNTT